jgi:hypothetical protein
MITSQITRIHIGSARILVTCEQGSTFISMLGPNDAAMYVVNADSADLVELLDVLESARAIRFWAERGGSVKEAEA